MTTTPVEPELSAVVRSGGVTTLDERGLMPLAEARAILRGTTAFAKGDFQAPVDGHSVLGSDVLWSALLSLEDAAEFCTIATELQWQFSPRGMENVDLWRRYGEGLVPWLATRVVDGVLHDQPWCVVPCLLACGSAAAFDLVWGVRRVQGRSVPLPTAWLDRHPEAGAAFLAVRARGGDPRARALLAAMRARGEVDRVAAAVAAIGDPDGALAWLLGGPPTAAGVLALLDACAARLVSPELNVWPRSNGEGPRRSHGLRAIAARHGDDWGLAIEQIEGDRPGAVYPARIAVHAFGSKVGKRWKGAQVAARPLPVAGAPANPVPFVRWLGERLAREPEKLWGPPAACLGALGLPKDARIVAVIPTLAHVDGPALDGEPVDAERNRLPSESPVYRALADALAAPLA